MFNFEILLSLFQLETYCWLHWCTIWCLSPRRAQDSTLFAYISWYQSTCMSVLHCSYWTLVSNCHLVRCYNRANLYALVFHKTNSSKMGFVVFINTLRAAINSNLLLFFIKPWGSIQSKRVKVKETSKC